MPPGTSASLLPPLSTNLSDVDDTVVIDHDDVQDYNTRQILPETPNTIRTLHSWLRPTAYDLGTSEYRKHLTSCLDGTGNWLTSTAAYKSWLYGDAHGILWLKGAPGSGKSVLTAKLIDELSRSRQPVVYFFFRQIIDANREPISLFRDWLAQILVYSPPLQQQLKTYIEANRSVESLSVEDLKKNLRVAFDSLPGTVFCVADALDEVDDGSVEDFLASMADFGQWRPDKVKVFFTSRPIPSIESALTATGCKPLQVRLTEEVVNQDISAFVDDELRACRLPLEDQNVVKQVVASKAKGLFLHAKLAMDAIRQPDAAGRITEVLSSLPHSLNDMYTSLLREHERRSGVKDNIQLLILQCATHTTRPLRLIEIADMINTTDNSFGLRDVGVAKEVVRRACGPFLEILPDETVSVVHHSFTEYLKGSSRAPTGENPGYPILLPGSTHARLALVCLSYLQNGCLDRIDISESRGDLEDLDAAWDSKPSYLHTLLEYPFLKYAAANWHIHVVRSILAGHDQAKINEEIDSFLGNQRWLAACTNVSWPAMGHTTRELTPLHVAAGTGLTRYVEHLLEPSRRTVNIDDCDGDGTTALWRAASAGHADIIAQLASAGANADHGGSTCGLKPIHEAARKGHHEAVRALLEAGVDPLTPCSELSDSVRWWEDRRPCQGDTALKSASRNGHVKTVEVLLSYAKDVDAAHQALTWAVQGRSSKLVHWLLQSAGVDVNTEVHGVMPLVHACYGHFYDVETIGLLLGAGADPNACIKVDKSALNWSLDHSFQSGSEDWGAAGGIHEIQDDTRGWTPFLEFCSQTQRDFECQQPETMEAMFRSFLRAGANIHQQDERGRTALHETALSSLLTRLLLEAGANPNITDNSGRTALHEKPCREVITLLVRHGADINRRDKANGRTPLHCQVEDILEQNDEGMIALLENGADCNVPDNDGNGALHLALKNDKFNIGVIKLFLDAGADLNLKNKAGETPLLCVSRGFREDNMEMVDLMLAAGADINARDAKGTTLLFRMVSELTPWSFNRDKSNADMDALRSRGASITVRDDAGRTVLHQAVRSYNSNTYNEPPAGSSSDRMVTITTRLDYFLGHGLDARVVDNAGNSLLHAIATEQQSHFYLLGIPDPISVLRKLVGLGVDPVQPNKKGRTALHVLCGQRHSLDFPIGHTLPIDYAITLMGEAINAHDDDGLTALHLAATVSECYVKKLLDAGANPTAATLEGLTPLHLAARARLGNNVGMLLDALYSTMGLEGRKTDGAKQTTTLPGAWFHERLPSPIKGVNAKDKAGRTPLWYACRSCRPETVSLLLKAGASIHNENLFQACAGVEEEQKLWDLAWYLFPGWNEDCSGGLRIEDKHRPLTRNYEWHVYQREPTFGDNKDRLEEILALLVDAGADLSELESLELDTRVTDHDEEEEDSVSDRYARPCLRSLRETYRKNPKRTGDDVGFEPFPLVALHQSHLIRILSNLSGTEPADDDNDDGAAGGFVVSRPRPIFRYPNGSSVPGLLCAARRQQPSIDIIRCLIECFDVNVNEVIEDGERSYLAYQDCAILELASGRHWWQAALALPYLLDHGANHQARGGANGAMPLHVSLSVDADARGTFQREAARALLSRGADPNAIDGEGRSCLSYAAGLDVALVQLVLDAEGARMAPDALFSAIDSGNVDVLEILLEAGADANARRDEFGTNPRKRRWNAEKALGTVTENCIDYHEWYPVHYAATHREMPVWFDSEKAAAQQRTITCIVKLLLDHGANPYATFRRLVTVDHATEDDKYAGEYEELSVLHEIILSCGIAQPFLLMPDLDPNHRDPSGQTVLHAACASLDGPDTRLDQFDMSNTSEKDKGAAGSPSIFSHLLSLGADPFILDHAGRNVLHHIFAERTRYFEDEPPAIAEAVAELTKSYPALVSGRDKRGRTPLLNALFCVVEAVDPVTAKTFAEAANMLLSTGRADPTAADHDGRTALHILAPELHQSVPRGLFQMLVSLHGLDVNARNAEGETPAFAFVVAATESKDCASLVPSRRDATAGLAVLRAAGADLLTRDDRGRGLLHVAARKQRGSRRGRRHRFGWPGFRTLWKLGLDPLAEDGERRTPLDVAAARGNDEVLQLFEKGRAEGGADVAESSDESEEDE